jgi:hypothetical protein
VALVGELSSFLNFHPSSKSAAASDPLQMSALFVFLVLVLATKQAEGSTLPPANLTEETFREIMLRQPTRSLDSSAIEDVFDSGKMLLQPPRFSMRGSHNTRRS